LEGEVGRGAEADNDIGGFVPYKSDAQRRYFHYAEEKGKISSKVVKEFDKASKGKSLPEHVKEFHRSVRSK
jgi:hypothetical protein